MESNNIFDCQELFAALQELTPTAPYARQLLTSRLSCLNQVLIDKHIVQLKSILESLPWPMGPDVVLGD